MRRFYWADIPETTRFELPEEESKHIVRVLRMQEGDTCLLLNGKGALVTVKIVAAHPKRCGVEVVERKQAVAPEKRFHLAIAPTKNMDRMEWMVEKVVEIGATEITFLQCDHSERVQLKLDRLQRVAISAMKQAEQDYLIVFHPLTKFDDFIQLHPKGCIAHCMDTQKLPVQHSSQKDVVLIGPEGDFSAREIALAQESGYDAVTLGDSRLRTETAGMVAAVLAINS
jgi:16S rRNA (uracil1498-N3)-methyltransferase